MIVALLGAAALWATLFAVESTGQSSGLADHHIGGVPAAARPDASAQPRPDSPAPPPNCTPPDCRPPSPGGTDGPAILVNDVCAVEGDSGLTPMVFTITRSGTSTGTSSVRFRTNSGEADVGKDFRFKQGSLVFAPGQTTKKVTVMVIGDTQREPDEDMRLALSGATGAVLTDTSGRGTILDDDRGPAGRCGSRAPHLSVLDACTVEGNTGYSQVRVHVRRTGDLSGESRMNFGTRDGTATQPSDYTSIFGTFRFQTGQEDKNTAVQIKGDTTAEDREQFQLFLFNVQGAEAVDSVGNVTIVDNDSGPLKPCTGRGGVGPKLTISDARVTEGDSGVTWMRFNVTLSQPSSKLVSVKFQTVPGTAHTGTDYAVKNGFLNFQPGQTAKFTRIKIYSDRRHEPTERFTVKLFNAESATIAHGVGTGTILDDD